MTGPWIKLWRSFITDSKIQSLLKRDGHACVTLVVTLLCVTSDGHVTASREELADMCNIDDDTCASLLEKIASKGIITIENDGKIRMNNWDKYQVSSSTERKRRQRDRERDKAVTCHADVTPMSRDCHKNVTVEVEDRSKKIDKDIKTIPQTFEEFWKAYPRKVGKADAGKKYKAILKAGTDHEIIMSRLKAYQAQIEAQHTESQYIRYPARFLNTLDDFESAPPVKNPEPEEREIECVVVTPEFRELIARSYQQPGEEEQVANV